MKTGQSDYSANIPETMISKNLHMSFGNPVFCRSVLCIQAVKQTEKKTVKIEECKRKFDPGRNVPIVADPLKANA